MDITQKLGASSRILTCLETILADLITSQRCDHFLASTPGRAQSLLLHPHSWVRLGSARLYGRLFAAYEPEEIVSGEGKKRRKKGKKAGKDKKVIEYLLQDSVLKVSWAYYSVLNIH